MAMPESKVLQNTPLHALHLRLGARMVPFAGYDMPVHYRDGILKEHLHTRAAAGLFDVSHMGQALLSGRHALMRLEALVPGDLQRLKPGQMRYTQLLNAEAGILDDLMVTRLSSADEPEDRMFLVVNAANKAADFAHITAQLPELDLLVMRDRALLALQGPAAAEVMAALFPASATMPFVSMRRETLDGAPVYFSRCGYTGEDGFEISLVSDAAAGFAEALLAHPKVAAIGLGARDSLRLEAGLCLHGHDITPQTTPLEAHLGWSISRRRMEGGGFPGDAVLQAQHAQGPRRLRVGIRPEGRAPVREGAIIADGAGREIGIVTSGGFSPSLNAPIAMGYVASAHAAAGTAIQLALRGQMVPAQVVGLPFVPTRYFRSPS